ncbi:MAG: type II toxin-antitoxin system RelE/ParE family toxin [Acidobacteriota bacterium]
MVSFKHRGLKKLYESGDGSKVRADQRKRIADVLFHLDNALAPTDLDLPGYRLHRLKGDLKGAWSISVSGNWRITFRFADGDAREVNLIAYH